MERKDWFIIATGLFVGVMAAVLVKLGNPGNMGICVACFLRDVTGALGLHQAKVVQYLRPEIPGLILGGTVAAVVFKEFRGRGGSGTLVRFVLGILMMVGALMFLGCPLRMLLRLGGGDLNAILGLVGFVAGVLVGVPFLKRGFNLGRSQQGSLVGALVLPLAAIIVLVLAVLHPVFDPKSGGPIFASVQGPGSQHAPLLISLAAALVIGFLAQRVRLCLSGGVRDLALSKDTYLLKGYGGILLGVLAANLVFNQFSLGWLNQPVAHTDGLWNLLGMALVGIAAVFAGGCPLRQLILGGQGDTDAGVTVLGMVAGAAIAHNFLLASSAAGPTLYGKVAVVIGIVVCLLIGRYSREA